MRIYVAGPMRGISYFNFPAFDAAAEMLSSLGHCVVNPAQMDRESGFDPSLLPSETDWSDTFRLGFDLGAAIRRDVEAIFACDAIYMLAGWEKSQGARVEHDLARWLGLEVMYATLPDEQMDVLDIALKITRGDRNVDYGSPVDDFRKTAAMWSAIKGVPFEAKEVALFMILVKVSRESHSSKRDNWVDIAGYARCGSLCG